MNRIERHDVTRSAMYLPWPFSKPELWTDSRLKHFTPRHQNGKLIGYDATILQELRDYAERNIDPWLRFDILLWHEKHSCTCSSCGNSHEGSTQREVHPGPNGTLLGDVDLIPTDEDHQWALEESRKCWETAQREPLFMRFYYER